MTRNWYYLSGNRQFGPLTVQELAKIASQGRIERTTRVREGATGAWVAASTVKGIFPAPVAATPPPLTASSSDCLPLGQLGGSSRDGLPMVAVAALAVAVIGALVLAAVALMNQPERKAATTGVGSDSLEVGGTENREGTASQRRGVGPTTEKGGDTDKMEKGLSDGPIGQLKEKLVPTDVLAEPFLKGTSSAKSWTAEIAERAKHGVVQVEVVTLEGVSKGTGFVIASKGRRHLVVTNKHVIDQGRVSAVGSYRYAKECKIVNGSGGTEVGKLAALAKNPDIDAAILLVESDELKTLGPVAKFETLGEGDDVVAVGNPGIPGTHITLNQTLTKGIISGKREELYVQTDAAINHGNSGGPLMNQRGEIVGINTYSFSGVGAPGLGLAIRADVVLDRGEWRFSLDVSDLMAAVSE